MHADRMYVAVETFEAFVDGRLERVTAGRDHVRTGHALFERYPDRFRLASGRTLAMRAVEDRAGGEHRAAPGMVLV